MTFTKHLLFVHIAVLLFGWSGLFANWIALSAIMIVLGRVFFASLFLTGAHLISGKKLRLDNSSAYVPFIVTGALLAAHWGTFFQSIQVSTVAVGLITFATFPVFASFLEPVFFREKFQKDSFIYAFTALAGVWLVATGDHQQAVDAEAGAVWGLLSAVTFAFLSLMNRKYVAERSSVTVGLYQNVFAFIWLFPLFIYAPVVPSLKDILLLVLLGIVFTGGAHVLFITGLRKINVRKASVITTMEPVYGILAAMLFFSEFPVFREWIGIGIILTTVIFVSLRKS